MSSAVTTVWMGFIICFASGLLYLINDFPTGTPPDSTHINFTWPAAYAAVTFVFSGLLILATRKPPSRLEGWIAEHFSKKKTLKLFLFVCLIFHLVTCVALSRRLSQDGWSANEIGVLIVISLSVGLIVWTILIRDVSVRLAVICISVAGLLLRLAAFQSVPLNVETADMLPLIQSAGKAFLSGSSPYRLYDDLHSWPLPLTYLPVKWLAYLPTIAAGLDLRLTNAIAEIVALWVLAFSRPIPKQEQEHDLGLETVLGSLIYLSPAIVIFDWYTEFPIFWSITLAVYSFLLREQFWAAAISWGLSLATSPLNWVVSPFIAAYLFSRVPLYQGVKLGALAASIALLITLPFVIWSPQEFIFGTLTWFNDLEIAGRSSWILANHRQLFQIGFSGWFWYFGLEGALKPVQALLVLLIFALFWKKRRKGKWLLLSSLWAYTLFCFFNVIIWPYFYVLPLWLLALYAIHSRANFLEHRLSGNRDEYQLKPIAAAANDSAIK